MPLYTITTQAGVLDSRAKSDLADKLTAFHAEYAAVPKNWVHIVFHEYPMGGGFTAGRPSPTAALTLLIRTGRSADIRFNIRSPDGGMEVDDASRQYRLSGNPTVIAAPLICDAR